MAASNKKNSELKSTPPGGSNHQPFGKQPNMLANCATEVNESDM